MVASSYSKTPDTKGLSLFFPVDFHSLRKPAQNACFRIARGDNNPFQLVGHEAAFFN